MEWKRVFLFFIEFNLTCLSWYKIYHTLCQFSYFWITIFSAVNRFSSRFYFDFFFNFIQNENNLASKLFEWTLENKHSDNQLALISVNHCQLKSKPNEGRFWCPWELQALKIQGRHGSREDWIVGCLMFSLGKERLRYYFERGGGGGGGEFFKNEFDLKPFKMIFTKNFKIRSLENSKRFSASAIN